MRYSVTKNVRVEDMDMWEGSRGVEREQRELGAASTRAAGHLHALLAQAGLFEALFEDPDFRGLAREVCRYPDMLTDVLAEVARRRPALLAAIAANRAEFLEALALHASYA